MKSMSGKELAKLLEANGWDYYEFKVVIISMVELAILPEFLFPFTATKILK
jgi:hypothetical protein